MLRVEKEFTGFASLQEILLSAFQLCKEFNYRTVFSLSIHTHLV